MQTTIKIVIGLAFVVHTISAQQVPVLPQGDGSEFVIAAPAVHKKKHSTNELKEEIGQQTKHAFEGTTHLLKQVGGLQKTWAVKQKTMCSNDAGLAKLFTASAQMNESLGSLCVEIAALQTTYTAVIEKLIDNKKPFKKAPKVDLEKTLDTLTSMHKQLAATAQTVVRLEKTVKAPAIVDQKRLHLCAANLQREHGKVHALVVLCKQDTCLKGV